MRKTKLVGLGAGFYLLASVVFSGTAMAETVRAYVLVEAKSGQREAAVRSLNGLGNCLALTHAFMSDEIVAHLECDNTEYLSVAVANNIAKSDAVARVTTLAVLKRQ
jgi:hypothetical protein